MIMETKVMLEKILKKGELDPAQQVEILSLLRAEHLSEDSIEKLFQRDFLSLDQKIELLGKLISEKAQKVICEEYLIASLGVKEKVDITLRASDSIDPNINIRNFLKGL